MIGNLMESVRRWLADDSQSKDLVIYCDWLIVFYIVRLHGLWRSMTNYTNQDDWCYKSLECETQLKKFPIWIKRFWPHVCPFIVLMSTDVYCMHAEIASIMIHELYIPKHSPCAAHISWLPWPSCLVSLPAWSWPTHVFDWDQMSSVTMEAVKYTLLTSWWWLYIYDGPIRTLLS